MAAVPPQLPPEVLETCQDDKGPMLLIIAWTFLALAIIAVFLRLYFRYTLRNGLNADDWTMLASLVCPPSPLNQSKPSE